MTAGQGIASGLATILSGSPMLDWPGERHGDEAAVEAGRRINRAVELVLSDGRARPRDLGGQDSTDAAAESVCRALGGV